MGSTRYSRSFVEMVCLSDNGNATFSRLRKILQSKRPEFILHDDYDKKKIGTVSNNSNIPPIGVFKVVLGSPDLQKPPLSTTNLKLCPSTLSNYLKKSSVIRPECKTLIFGSEWQCLSLELWSS